MGLDTTHDAWHGGYISFNWWRRRVARAIGIPLDLMDGFCEWTLDGDDRDDITKVIMAVPESGAAFAHVLGACVDVLPLKWESFKPDQLHALLHHSDCDGEIAAELCGPIADRLDALLPELDGEFRGEPGWFQKKAEQFSAGCRRAAAANESLEFH